MKLEKHTILRWTSLCSLLNKTYKSKYALSPLSFVTPTIMERQVEFDPRLKHPFTCMVVGSTQCGKTRFVLELIRRSRSIHPPQERLV